MYTLKSLWVGAAVAAFALWGQPAAAEHDNWEIYMEAALGEIEAGNYAQAAAYLDTALVEAEDLGPGTPSLPQTLEVLAAVYIKLDRGDEAEPLYQRIVALQEKNYGPEHTYVAAALDLYAAFLRGSGRGDEAEPLVARARAIRAD